MFIQLVDAVRDAFVARGFNEVSVVDGIESPNDQTNYGDGSANRVAFVASKDNPLGILPPTHIGEDEWEGHCPGQVRRQLLNVRFFFDVHIAAYDADHPDRELAHRYRCFDIWECVIQEVQRKAWGLHDWIGARWSDDRKQGRHGAELVATLAINIPLFDVESVIAKPAPVPGQPKPVT